MKKLLLITSSLVLAFVLSTIQGSFVSAQISPQLPSGLSESIDVRISPEYPESNQDVSIQISTYITDLSKTNVIWYLNGREQKRGIAQRDFTFKTGNPGTSSVVRIVVESGNRTLEETLTIRPSEVDLINEAVTYVPQFYDGRPIATHQSVQKFIAIPNMYNTSGRRLSSAELYFKWEINGDVDLNNSGVGKNYYVYEGSLISRPTEVIVIATDINSDLKARKIKTFEMRDPKILFYENHPNLGTLFNLSLYQRATLNKKEVEMIAIPFNFDIKSISDNQFSWIVNGKNLTELTGNSILFRRENDLAGQAQVNLMIKNSSKLLQNSKTILNLIYNRSTE